MESLRILLLAAALPALALAADTPAAPALPRPLTLDAAIAFAAEHNPTLLRTREQIREQEGVLLTVRATRLPTVAASGQTSRTDADRLESPVAADRAWSVSVAATQVLYAGGGARARERSQRAQLAAARLAFAGALNDTALTVRQQFYAILLDRELIAVQEESLRVLEGEEVNARHRRDAGTGSDFDLLRAQVAVANAKPALIRARNAYRLAQDSLRATLGVPARDAVDLGVTGSLVTAPRDVALADALAAAREHRPELLRQQRLEAAADESIEAAKSGYRPTVSATADYTWMRPSLTTTTASNLHGWSAGLQASWNLFDGRSTAGQLVQARARARQTRYSTEDLELTVELDVRTALANLSEAQELLRAAEQGVTQAEESLRQAQARLAAGVANQLDVLTAQSALTEARSNLVQARHSHAVAAASLDRATGANGLVAEEKTP